MQLNTPPQCPSQSPDSALCPYSRVTPPPPLSRPELLHLQFSVLAFPACDVHNSGGKKAQTDLLQLLNGTHIENWSMQWMDRRGICIEILGILYMTCFKSCILRIKHVSYILYSYLSTQLWNPCALCAITSILLKMNAGGDDKKRELM